MASNLNYVSGQTVANQVVVKVGSGGRVNLVAATSGMHVIADVAGFFTTGAPFMGVTPARLVDTRALDSLASGKLSPNAPLSLSVTGRAGLPPSGVGAAVLNVTATESDGTGYLTAYLAGEPRPLASSLNFGPGATVPGMVVAAVGSGGRVDLSSPASTHVIADLAGWIPEGAGYEAMVPLRVIDTRDGIETAAGFVPSNGVVELDVAKVPGLPATGVRAVSLNVTVTQTASPGYVTVYPEGQRPLASNLNYVAGDTIANSVIAQVGVDGKVRLYANGRLTWSSTSRATGLADARSGPEECLEAATLRMPWASPHRGVTREAVDGADPRHDEEVARRVRRAPRRSRTRRRRLADRRRLGRQALALGQPRRALRDGPVSAPRNIERVTHTSWHPTSRDGSISGMRLSTSAGADAVIVASAATVVVATAAMRCRGLNGIRDRLCPACAQRG